MTYSVSTPRAGAPAAVSSGVGRLLARADAELMAAAAATEPAERFVHAHLGALRAAAAIVAFRGLPARRPRVRSVWDQLALAAPELASWSGYFAGGARERAAVDAGRFDAVAARRADELVTCAEDFRDEVAMLIDPGAGFVQHLRPGAAAS